MFLPKNGIKSFDKFRRTLLFQGIFRKFDFFIQKIFFRKDQNKTVFLFDQKIAAGVDRAGEIVYDTENQTVEAEITAVTPLQRARGAESWVRNELSNGPLRAQSNVILTEYSATLQADVICRGYVGILLSARVIP